MQLFLNRKKITNIKKITTQILIIALIAIIQSSEAFGDATTDRKKNCLRTWNNKAEARIRNSYTWDKLQNQENRKCGGTAQAYVRQGPVGGSPRSEAQAWRAHNRNDVWAFTNWHAFTPGDDPYILFQNNLLNSNTDFGKGEVNLQNDIDFVSESGSNNDISSNYLTGYMLIENHGLSDFYATYEITVWLPSTEDDELITDDKTIWRSTIKLTKNGVIGTGIFENENSYNITQTDYSTLITFNFESIHIDLPEGDLPYTISTKGHVGHNSNGSESFLSKRDINNAYLSNNAQQLENKEDVLLENFNLSKFDVYPIPSESDIKVEFSTTINETVIIDIYDYSGSKIKTIYNGEAKKETLNTIEISKSEIPAGKYQLLVRIGEKKFIRPILIN